MRPYRLFLTVLNILVMSCALFFQAGCGEENTAPMTLSPNWFQQQKWAAINQQAQQRMTAEAPSVTKGPRIEFEKLTHDFGEVGPGTKHLSEFRFTNTGDEVLKIHEVSKVCGCTPFVLEKAEYAPGETGILRVGYVAELLYGSTKKQLFVRSNDRQNPKVTLNVTARIVSKVDVEPKSLRLSLKDRNAGCPAITLRSIDNRPFSITSFKSTANFITADYDPSATATSFVLRPKVNMAKLEQNTNGRIEIELTHPECKTVSISVGALPRFKVSPRPIVVRDAQQNRTVTRKVRIQSNYDDDFEIDSVSSKKNTVKVLNKRKIEDGYEFELNITPPVQKGRMSHFTDVVIFKLKSGRSLEIPCNGFYPRQAGLPRIPIGTGTTDSEDCPTCGPKIF